MIFINDVIKCFQRQFGKKDSRCWLFKATTQFYNFIWFRQPIVTCFLLNWVFLSFSLFLFLKEGNMQLLPLINTNKNLSYQLWKGKYTGFYRKKFCCYEINSISLSTHSSFQKYWILFSFYVLCHLCAFLGLISILWDTPFHCI